MESNDIFSLLKDFFDFLPPNLSWLSYVIAGLILTFSVANALLITTAFFTYMERRVLGRFQSRLGPNRVGPFGLLQPFADVLKLVMKEDIRPAAADRLIFFLAPIVLVVPVFLLIAVVPFGKNMYIANLNIGALFIVAVTTVAALAIFLGGWGSGNRFALLGASRAVAMLISYEVPMILSLVGIVILSGSMSLVDIVEAQRLPYFLLQPIGFFVFFLAATAEMNRPPFDLLEAESELVAGFHTEYSGTKFALLYLAEFAEAVVFAGIFATLFFRGWQNPFVPQEWFQFFPSQIWFFLKVIFFLFIFVWIRATLPRLRIDQVMSFAWKVLFPLSLINLVLTAILVTLWPEPSVSELWFMVIINLIVGLICLLIFTRFLEQNRSNPTQSVFLANKQGGQ
ncbi:MAG: NADH-quinone oxidoreductase subunit NuoH [Chloroflexi bacterium]|nr:NADH-quinone oxidoreductase subunit NuoH [Chloroflexota bacterium]|tara:strand:+ start:25939 stop:27129 length:1191 start_codon:yes stop_codon:yes gene_type:complete